MSYRRPLVRQQMRASSKVFAMVIGNLLSIGFISLKREANMRTTWKSERRL